MLQCGFIAGGPAQPSQHSKDVSSCLPVPIEAEGAAALVRPFPGGWGFGLAATADGVLYAWGVNSATLLGKQGGADDGADPNTLDEVARGVVAAGAGFDHGLVVTAAGAALTFGPHVPRPAGTPPGLYLAPLSLDVKITAVAAGEHHSLLLAEGGTLLAFGSNREGQLGTGSTAGAASPLAVLGPGLASGPAELRVPVTAVAAGARHSAAVNADGRCLAWGWDLHGQCGTGDSRPSAPTPALVGALGPLRCVSVAAGLGHTVVATDSGDAYAWGLNEDGQLGNGSAVSALRPQLVDAAVLESEHVSKVAAGARHTVLLCSGGAAYSFGCNKFGQAGTGSFEAVRTPARLALPAGRAAADVEAGWWHTLVLTR